MQPDKHFAATVCTVVAACGLIAATWFATIRAGRTERRESTAQMTARLENQALAFSEQINRQLLAIDQTLQLLAAAWQADPTHFDLQAAHSRTVVLDGLSRDMVVTDANGIVRQSTVNEAIGQNAAGQGYFRTLATHAAARSDTPLNTQPVDAGGAPTSAPGGA